MRPLLLPAAWTLVIPVVLLNVVLAKNAAVVVCGCPVLGHVCALISSSRGWHTQLAGRQSPPTRAPAISAAVLTAKMHCQSGEQWWSVMD